jgi:hypothetical protein
MKEWQMMHKEMYLDKDGEARSVDFTGEDVFDDGVPVVEAKSQVQNVGQHSYGSSGLVIGACKDCR